MTTTSIQQVIEIAPVSDSSRTNEVQRAENNREEKPALVEENKGRNIDLSA